MHQSKLIGTTYITQESASYGDAVIICGERYDIVDLIVCGKNRFGMKLIDDDKTDVLMNP
jgi:hypothetical protein